MNDKQIKRLIEIQKNMDGGAVQPEELTVVIEFILDTLTSLINDEKKEHNENLNKCVEDLQSLCENMDMRHKQSMSSVKDECFKKTDKAIKDVIALVDSVKQTIPEMPDLSEYDSKLEELEGYIDEVNDVEETPEEIKDKLQSLKGNNRLDESAIKGLDERFARLEKMIKDSTNKVGVLNRPIFGNMSQRIRFIDDETPSGTINGSNTVFILSKTPIDNSLKVYRGGARQRVAQDYTISNKTITFTVAPEVGEVLLADYRTI